MPAKRSQLSKGVVGSAWMPTTDFWAFLQDQTPDFHVSSSREVYRLLEGGRGLSQRPRLRLAQRLLKRTLEDKTRIYSVAAGNAANVKSDWLSMRMLLKLAQSLLAHFLKVAASALGQTELQISIRYGWSGSDESSSFSEATSRSVASPHYLRWAKKAAALKPRQSAVLCSYLEEETEILRRSLDLGRQYEPESFSEIDIPSIEFQIDQLDLALCNEEQGIRDLIGGREGPRDGAWAWQQPWHSGAAPWPFPKKLMGYEDPTTLRSVAESWDAFGRNLACLDFDYFYTVSDEESDRHYLLCMNAWAVLVDAALAIRYLAAVLKSLSKCGELASPVCTVCYRHRARSGSGLRTRCEIHTSSAKERGRDLRLKEFASRYVIRLEELLASSSHKMRRPQDIFGNCYRFGQATNAWFGLGAHPVMRGDRPFKSRPVGESFDHLCSGLRALLKALEPICGADVGRSMAELAERVIGAVHEVIQPGRDVANFEVIEQALRYLTPPGFFCLWFGGVTLRPKTASAFVFVGTDPHHPLFENGRSAPSTVGAWIEPTTGQMPQFCPTRQIVGDLLRYRAWLDIGGGTVDQAMRAGQLVPSDKARRQLSAEKVNCAANRHGQGESLAEIATDFGVSRQAIFYALKKLKAVGRVP